MSLSVAPRPLNSLLNQKPFESFAPLPGYEAAVVVEDKVRRWVRFNGFPRLAS
jgi:hypothetical protein